MKVVLTSKALRQFDEVLRYLEARNPQGAQRVKAVIGASLDLLGRHPLAGHVTDRPGLRRLIASPYPYAIFYRVTPETVIVQRIRHTSRAPTA